MLMLACKMILMGVGVTVMSGVWFTLEVHASGYCLSYAT